MKKLVLTLVSAAAILLFISCGSKPAPEEPVQPSAPEVEVTEPAAPAPVAEPEENSVVLEEPKKEDNSAEEEAARQAALEAARQAAMEKIQKAQAAKQKIDDNGFAEYDQNSYDEGCKYLSELEALLNSEGELDESDIEKADKAYSNFNTVLIIAYKKLSKEERAAAYEAKKLADSVKAAVSQKERYTQAADAFTNGDSLYSMQNPEAAYESYKSSKEQFNTLYEEVNEKRAAALAALEAAKKRVEESQNFAEEADIKAPITEPIEGIEEEDAVLLEEDNYENPEDAEVDIAETIEDEEMITVETVIVPAEETVQEAE